jgi:hypothetical protein
MEFRFWVESFGVRVEGLGCGVWSLVLRVRVWSLEFGVNGEWFMVYGAGFKIQGFRVCGLGLSV